MQFADLFGQFRNAAIIAAPIEKRLPGMAAALPLSKPDMECKPCVAARFPPENPAIVSAYPS